MKVVDPKGVASRAEAFGIHRRRREFSIKGPNRVLSVDGHDKLSRFGFEIYRTIDAYSRYIVWRYVGISNRTAVSVNKQCISGWNNPVPIGLSTGNPVGDCSYTQVDGGIRYSRLPSNSGVIDPTCGVRGSPEHT